MKELFRTNDPVAISWVQAVLEDAGIAAVVLDAHTSVIEGSIGAIQRRVMVPDEDFERATKSGAQARAASSRTERLDSQGAEAISENHEETAISAVPAMLPIGPAGLEPATKGL